MTSCTDSRGGQRPTTLQNVTCLYGLRPQHVGEGQIESLSSYLYALARAHSFAISTFTNRVIPQLSAKAVTGCPTQLTKWESSASHSLLHNPGFALQLARCLMALTGRAEILSTNLCGLMRFVCGQALHAHEERICRSCLIEDLEVGRQPYSRLLWSIAQATCCPVHGTLLVRASCDVRGKRPFHATMGRFGDACCSCGSLATHCPCNPDAKASDLEVWKAKQIAGALEQEPNWAASSLVQLKHALRLYCDSRDGCERLAKRCGISKSVLSRWLNVPTARLSLAIMLDVCAAEGFSLAKLFSQDLTRITWPGFVRPSRVKRRVAGLDRERLEREIRQAMSEGREIREVAESCSAHVRSLRSVPSYKELRDLNARKRAQKRKSMITNAVIEAEAVLVELVKLGAVPSVRNASNRTGSTWAVSQTRCVALLALRKGLGDSMRLPDRSIASNPWFQSEIGKAVERLRRAVPNYGAPLSSQGVGAHDKNPIPPVGAG